MVLNENRLSAVERKTLEEIRQKARALPEFDEKKNALHWLAVDRHVNFEDQPLARLYKLWFVETARIRQLTPHKIRWFRAEWYGLADDYYYTPFKRFAQTVNPKDFDSRKDSQKMSIALSALVEDRVMDYADLMLQDNTRQRIQARAKGWNGIILAIEKDAMMNKEVENFAANLGILMLTSGKGEPSRNSNEMVYNIIKQSGLHNAVLLSITDYDQYGFFIENSFKSHLETYEDFKVTHIRVGTDPTCYPPDRLTPEDALYELPSSSEVWPGAIELNGIKYGIEMDTNSWSFYFKRIVEKLLEIGFTKEDFDNWARKAKWAREYVAIEEAITEIISKLNFYQRWMEEVAKLQKLKDILAALISEQLKPQADPIMAEPNFDDRPTQIEKLVDDLVKIKAYENRYSAQDLTDKLEKKLLDWFTINGRFPSEEEVLRIFEESQKGRDEK